MTDEIDTLWDYDDPAGSEARFRALLPEVIAGSSRHVQMLTQVARAQGLQRRFDAAHETLDEAGALLGEEMPRARARYLLERGRVFNTAGRREQALTLFHQALEAAQAAGLAYEAVDAAHMVAIACPSSEQLDWNLKALALAEQAEDERARRWLGSLYNNIGWTYHERGDYQKALAYFEKALDERKAAGEARAIRIARWSVARALRSLGRVEEALAIQAELQAAYEQDGEPSGYVYEELAEGNLELGNEAEARRNFATAYALLSQDRWLAGEAPERLRRLRRLGGAEERQR